MDGGGDQHRRRHPIDLSPSVGQSADELAEAWPSLAAPPPGGDVFAQPWARPWGRPWGKALAFLLAAILPTAAAAGYLFLVASDQYVSEFRFGVRHGHPGSAAARIESASLAEGLMGGPSLASVADAEMTVQYIRSHQILSDLAGQVDLDAAYARPDIDWLARLGTEETAERRLRHWRRHVDPYLDRTSGLVTVQVSAFAPQDARRVAAAVLALSERLVNRMSARARQDRVSYADAEVIEAEARLKRAGLALSAYRNRHGVLYPAMHAAENTGLDAQLRAQLAQAETALAAMRTQGISPDAPQARTLQTRADALRAEQRKLLAQLTQRGDAPPGPEVPAALPTAMADATSPAAASPAALATLLGGYDQLEVENRMAERAYDRAVQAQRQAQAQAAQQQIYLAAFVEPNLPQEALLPQRWRRLAEIALGGCALWALGCLLYYGLREHLDG